MTGPRRFVPSCWITLACNFVPIHLSVFKFLSGMALVWDSFVFRGSCKASFTGESVAG